MFGIRRDVDVTVTNIKKKWRQEISKHLHPDKMVGQNAQVRYLAKLLLAAAHHLCCAKELAEGRVDHGFTVPDAPDLSSYFRYNSDSVRTSISLVPIDSIQSKPKR